MYEKQGQRRVSVYLLEWILVYIHIYTYIYINVNVPDEKSSRSTQATRRPLDAASSAQPVPVAPPPMIKMSKGPSFNADAFKEAINSERGGGFQ